MTRDPTRHTLVNLAVDFLPPRVRRSLLDDQKFVEFWGLAISTNVTLGKDGPSFDRDRLNAGIREAICAPGMEISVVDSKKLSWRIKAKERDHVLSLSIQDGETVIAIRDHSGLADDYSTRTAWFERAANEVHLEGKVYLDWKTRIENEPLDDDEFSELTAELDLTPVINYQSLLASLTLGSVNISTLVPSERRYYDRLVGSVGLNTEVDDYIETGAVSLIRKLKEWEPKRGFLSSLLMCSKGSVSEHVSIEKLDSEQLSQTYELLAIKGDPISQMGAVEVALLHIERCREVEPFIEKMVEGFIADEVDDDGGCFSLLSATIVLVSAEMSRRQILKGVCPFYRRQAAIAQASLIIRAINTSQGDKAGFVEWVKRVGVSQNFYLQSLVDLRGEPRWLPDFVTPFQLRAEFIGRIRNSVTLCKGKIHSRSLRRLLMDKDSRLATAATWPFPMLPGPLEGGMTSNQPCMPNEILKEMTAKLEADQLEPNSFAELVNLALLFKMPASQAGLAATALRRVKYSVESTNDATSIFSLLGGLGMVAGVTRATDLAETVCVLARVMRRRKRLTVDPDEEMRIAMAAAAAYESVEEWARFSGEWITELAFEVVEKESARRFLQKLRRLVQIEPALARHCAVADAALESVTR